MAEIILPGTYITVRDEALISAGAVISGNIGIVGTASKGPVDEVQILDSFSKAKEVFGDGGVDDLNLIPALEQIYNNGGRTVYAVRVATDAKRYAAYQTKDEANANLLKLEAATPGTWGNAIRIKIGLAEKPSLVQEELSGDSSKFNRTNIVKDSSLNSIRLKQKSTGLMLRYEIVYDKAPDNEKQEVGIESATGKLTFTTLSGFSPIKEDTIYAVYEVLANNSKKIELSHGALKEIYIVADVAHLASQISQDDKPSSLVKPNKDDAIKIGFFNKLPQDTAESGELFGSGLDGHTPGNDGADSTDSTYADKYKDGLAKLENEIINIVILAGQDVSLTKTLMATNLIGHLKATADIKRERIGIIGSDKSDDVNKIAGHSLDYERLIFVAPGIKVSPQKTLSGAYTAAAVAGLISSLPVQASPTNKPLNIPGLSKEFSSSELEKLVGKRVLAIEKRDGIRVVKGITTATNNAWHQITTRRIVDYAIYGVRSACSSYIGKLNNERVRGAMKATLDAFLTRMVQDEALISYELAVSATRSQEIAGEAIVTMTLRPTFSIDFIKVTMYLG